MWSGVVSKDRRHNFRRSPSLGRAKATGGGSWQASRSISPSSAAIRGACVTAPGDIATSLKWHGAVGHNEHGLAQSERSTEARNATRPTSTNPTAEGPSVAMSPFARSGDGPGRVRPSLVLVPPGSSVGCSCAPHFRWQALASCRARALQGRARRPFCELAAVRFEPPANATRSIGDRTRCTSRSG
jgi:hypothetical protein